MDSSGFSQIGRYGTICLMKRHEPDTVVTSFGIDTEELTFGRDPTCGVRLYYSDVSLVHCKIVFEERKAFLIVVGTSGLEVDGCKVYPNASSSPMTIPLTNNSEFEIRGKRFRFTYPPKELRAALFATPARPPQRKLRLSMIHSAQVFSPRPSKDPRENLRILKSPLKNAFKSPKKSGTSTPVRKGLFSAAPTHDSSDEEEEADAIVLVDGNHPRVVEDEKDLVILEDVQLPDPRSHSPVRQHQAPPQQHLQPSPQTPVRKRSLSRNTLHRAVLIRSAQRAVLQAESAEREREAEEEEEMEVLETVASDAASGSEDDVDDDEDEDEKDAGESTDENDDDSDVEEYEEELRGREDERGNTAQKSTWRKSLERIWPFRSSSVPADEEDDNASNSDDEDKDSAEEQDQEGMEQEDLDVPAPLPVAPQPATPVRRALGSFMTPQVHPRIFAGSEQSSRAEDAGVGGAGRYSLGGEARRVITEQVWKVRDIVVPPVGSSSSQPGPSATPAEPSTPGRNATPMASPVRARQIIGEEERKAIQERRRSALREVDTFFGGGVPGMGASPGKRQGWSPAKTTSSTSSSSIPSVASSGISPVKPTSLFRRDDDSDEAEEMDTRSLLERMKETVEEMKRRRSLAPGGPGTPMTPARDARAGPSRPGTVSPRKIMAPPMMDVTEEEEEDKENVAVTEEKADVAESREEEVFSLLRPGVLEEVRAREEESLVEVEAELLESGGIERTDLESGAEIVDKMDAASPDTVTPVAVGEPDMDPISPVDRVSSADEDTNDAPAPKKSGRARLLRAKKPTPVPEEVINQPEPKVKPDSGRKTRASPQPVVEEIEKDVSENEITPDEPVEVPKTTTRRSRKAAEETTDEVEVIPPPTRRGRKAVSAEPPTITSTTKRGRKTTAEPEDTAPKGEAAAPAPSVRRGRKPTSVVTVPTEIPEETEPVPLKRSIRKTPIATEVDPPVRRGRTPRTAPSALPVRKTTTKKTADETPGAASGSGGVKGGTKTKPIEVDDGDDPLDSFDAAESEAVVEKPKGRKKVTKVEVVEDKIPAPITRRTKAKTPVVTKTPATKPRVKKDPASAPAAVQDVDKENTPGSEESSIGDEPVKIRVSRTKKGTTAATATATTRTTKVKQEERESVPAEPEAPRGRSVRVTRTRTRT